MKHSLKILHIGNIANNAYINAKLLAEAGHSNFVACSDFYHFAGCPEWNEIEFDVDRGFFGNPNMPDFWRLGRQKPATPHWFAQGPRVRVMTYLYFFTQPNRRLAHWAWCCLKYARFKVVNDQDVFADTRPWNEERFCEALAAYDLDETELRELSLGRVAEQISIHCRYALRRFADKAAIANLTFPLDRSWLAQIAETDELLKQLLGRYEAGTLLSAIAIEKLPLPPEQSTPPEGFSPEEVLPYMPYSEIWRHTMPAFDIVIGYGPDPIVPFLAGHSGYVGFEHGTLRDIPFDDSVFARLVKRAYENAALVFITNTDYFSQERQLGINAEKLCGLPHPFDERPLRAYVRNLTVNRLDKAVFFAPARQDWVKQYPSMTKNNHFVVHAARLLVDSGYSEFLVRFVEWGEDVEATKGLIESLGLDAYFEWVEPLAKRQLWMQYVSVHAVIDQFLLPSLSGVSFEALALGCRVITRDDGSNERAFGVRPPLLDAFDIASCRLQMQRVLDDPGDAAGLGQDAWEWIDRFHSARRILEVQEDRFRQLMS